MPENLDNDTWAVMSCFVATIVFTLFVVASEESLVATNCAKFNHWPATIQVQPLASYYISSTTGQLLYKFNHWPATI